MTADWFVFPADVLRRISSRITNEVEGVNRVTYDISSKPPAVSLRFISLTNCSRSCIIFFRPSSGCKSLPSDLWDNENI